MEDASPLSIHFAGVDEALGEKGSQAAVRLDLLDGGRQGFGDGAGRVLVRVVVAEDATG